MMLLVQQLVVIVELALQLVKTVLQCYLFQLKVSQLALLPQDKLSVKSALRKMVAQMDEEGFGNCTNTGALHEAECPKGISLENIARMNRELMELHLNNNQTILNKKLHEKS